MNNRKLTFCLWSFVHDLRRIIRPTRRFSALVGVFLISSVHAELFIDEGFDYSNGNLTSVSGGAWQAHSAGGSTPIQVVNDAAVLHQGSGSREDDHLDTGFTMASGDTWYSSFDVTITGGSTQVYFAHFKDAGNIFEARVFVTPLSGSNFTFGLSGSTTTPASTWGTGLQFGTTYKVVTSYSFDTGINKLWIDPIDDTSTSISASGSTGNALTSYAFRQAAGNSTEVIDNLKIGNSFDSVVTVPLTQINTRRAADTDTEWLDNPSNWTNGIPNNSPGKNFNVTMGSEDNHYYYAAIIDSPVTVTNLTANSAELDSYVDVHAGGSLTVNENLTNSGILGITDSWASVTSSGDITVTGSVGNSGRIQVYSNDSNSTFTFGSLDNTGSIDVISSGDTGGAKLSVAGSLAQQNAATLTAGHYQVVSNGNAPAVLEWDGANIHTIDTNATVRIAGANAVIRDRLTSANALTDLSENRGFLSIDAGASLNLSGGLTNSGQLYVDSYIDGATSTLNINGNFSNTGYVEAIGGVVSVNGTLVQQVGTTLTDGQFTVSGVIEWNGADIRTIGESANIDLTGAGIIRDRITGNNALANLSENRGFLAVQNDAQLSTGSFENSGDIFLEGGNAQLSVNGNLANSGYIQTQSHLVTSGDLTNTGNLIAANGGIVDVGNNFSLQSTGTFQSVFGYTYNANGDTILGIETGIVNVTDTAFLDGAFSITLADFGVSFLPSNSDIFTILQAAEITGTFANVLESGDRVSVYNFSHDLVGTFAINYSGTATTLTGFAVVPEVSGWGLLLPGFLATMAFSKKWRSRPRAM